MNVYHPSKRSSRPAISAVQVGRLGGEKQSLIKYRKKLLPLGEVGRESCKALEQK